MALMVLISLDNRQKTVQVLPDVLEESVEESQLRLNDGDKYFLPDILRRNAISKLFIYKIFCVEYVYVNICLVYI